MLMQVLAISKKIITLRGHCEKYYCVTFVYFSIVLILSLLLHTEFVFHLKMEKFQAA